MKKYSKFVYILSIVFFFLVVFISPKNNYAAEFYYEANDDYLSDVLCSFASFNSLGCELSPEINADEKLKISGNMLFETSDSFYSFMERNQNIIAYNNGASIYFCKRSEMENVLFTLQNTTVAQVNSALKAMKLLDYHFPLQSNNNGTLLRLSAPTPYIDIVTQVITDLEISSITKKDVRVFKLKHAWADDITLNFMDSQVVVPGIATLLRNLTGDMTVPTTQSSPVPSVNRLGGQGLAKSGGTQQANLVPQNENQEEKKEPTRILADQRLNAVIIWDDEDKMPFYETIIKELDVPVGLVEIRVAIVDINVNKSQELGLSWNFSSNIQNNVPQEGFGTIGGANVGENTNFLSNIGSGLNMTTIFTGGLDVFMAKINALEQTGDASVLSRPALLTMDNVQAVLENTETFYVEVAGKDTVDLFDVSYGTKLKVTPHIITNDDNTHMIKLAILVEDGGSAATPANYGTKLPTVSKSTITTQALVAENQTLIIGGHYKEVKEATVSGVPVLMNIPLLGNLFKTNNQSSQKKERIFVISPRLVDPNALPMTTPYIAESMNNTIIPQVNTPTPALGGCARQQKPKIL